MLVVQVFVEDDGIRIDTKYGGDSYLTRDPAGIRRTLDIVKDNIYARFNEKKNRLNKIKDKE